MMRDEGHLEPLENQEAKTVGAKVQRPPQLFFCFFHTWAKIRMPRMGKIWPPGSLMARGGPHLSSRELST